MFLRLSEKIYSFFVRCERIIISRAALWLGIVFVIWVCADVFGRDEKKLMLLSYYNATADNSVVTIPKDILMNESISTFCGFVFPQYNDIDTLTAPDFYLLNLRNLQRKTFKQITT